MADLEAGTLDYWNDRAEVMERCTLPSWRVDDRVSRPVDVYKQGSPLRHGEIVAAYSQPGYPRLYAVRWDDDLEHVSRGYFGYGLLASRIVRASEQETDRG